MQITSNTTRMETGICLATDKEGRDSCVIVIKGTYSVGDDGKVDLAEEQVPLVYTDKHYADPAETSIKYESDFAPFKPCCDVLVNGFAHAPAGKQTERVTVVLRVGPVNKSFDVVGNRIWDRGILSIAPTPPEPFTKMPITYDRAFGGVDISEKNPERHETYVSNPVGIGYYPLTKKKALIGKPLPNTEETGQPVKTTYKKYRPMSLGVMSRNFQARIKFAGTYDDKWKKERFPFLPQDFNERYYLSSPTDQQVPFLIGGETVSITNMSPDREFVFVVPKVDIPITCRFRDRDERPTANLDTMIVEPDERRFILEWRARVLLGRKVHSLIEVLVGFQPRPAKKQLKPHFHSIQEFIEWKKNRGLQ